MTAIISVDVSFIFLSLNGVPHPGSCLLDIARVRGDTHSKLVLRVYGAPAHRPGVVEPLHVVGFVKAERQEGAEIPGSHGQLLIPCPWAARCLSGEAWDWHNPKAAI
jgi:hypothetical protein